VPNSQFPPRSFFQAPFSPGYVTRSSPPIRDPETSLPGFLFFVSDSFPPSVCNDYAGCDRFFLPDYPESSLQDFLFFACSPLLLIELPFPALASRTRSPALTFVPIPLFGFFACFLACSLRPDSSPKSHVLLNASMHLPPSNGVPASSPESFCSTLFRTPLLFSSLKFFH